MIENEWITGNNDYGKALAVRKEVFGEDKDCYDNQAMHLVVYDNDSACGVGRIFHNGKHFYIDKVCVLKSARGKGLGDLVTRLLIFKAVGFSGEVFAEKCEFLKQFGFKVTSEGFCVKKEELVFPSKCKEGENGI